MPRGVIALAIQLMICSVATAKLKFKLENNEWQYFVQLGQNSTLMRLYHIGDMSSMEICKFSHFKYMISAHIQCHLKLIDNWSLHKTRTNWYKNKSKCDDGTENGILSNYHWGMHTRQRQQQTKWKHLMTNVGGRLVNKWGSWL